MAAASEVWTTVFNEVKDSIFFVVLAPRSRKIGAIMHRAAKVRTVENYDKRKDRCNGSWNSTGFVVEERNNKLLICTCAHGIDHVYKGSVPISANEVNALFEVTVLCDHYECEFRAAGRSELDGADERIYARGTIISINCPQDLLLVEVEKEEIKQWSREEMCGENHPVLEISQNFPRTGADSMLFSWPAHKHRTIATGTVGVRRTMQEICRPNLVEYDMLILEAQISSEAGSSGGPLLNKSGKVIGLLHGRFGGTHSYFVPPNLIQSFLDSAGINSDRERKVKLEKEGKGKGKEVSGEQSSKRPSMHSGEGKGSGEKSRKH